MAMSDLQRYPRNLNLIKNVEDTIFFITLKLYIHKIKHGFLINYLIRKSCKVVNCLLKFERSFEITLTDFSTALSCLKGL